MGKIKHTKENLEIIKNCISVREALSILGIKPDGGNKRIRSLIKDILIENGNYKGQAHSKSKSYVKVSNEDFFNKNSTRKSYAIREALISRGLKEHRCESCKLDSWMGKKIPLEVHHIDGDKTNNELTNLKILCPNCHTFTDNYKGKNIKK